MDDTCTPDLNDFLCRSQAILGVGQALARLQSVETIDELIERIPHETVKLGYNRALFSWVRQSRWVAQSACSSRGPSEAKAMIMAGSAVPRDTRHLVESALLQGGSAILVSNVAGNPRIHQELLQVTHSVSYVAAPLIAGRTVIGLLHADENVVTGGVDTFDRDLLATFCAGLGLAYERTALMEQVSTIRTRMHEQLQALDGLVDECTQAKQSRVMLHDLEQGHWPSSAGPSQLTPRESEVLRLLAGGLTNAQIGDRLYVAEGTVKSHVKHVLRKLGAANRAEAVSLFHRRSRAGR